MSLKETHKYFSSRRAAVTSQDRCGFWVFPSTSSGVASVADGSLTGHHTAVISSLARGVAGREVSLLNDYLFICFFFLLGYSKAQKQLSTRVELKAFWAGTMAQWLHLIILGQCPEPTRWEERTDSHKLSFDLYLCAVAHAPHNRYI